MMKQNTSSQRPQGKLRRNTSTQFFATETAFEYKYQMAMETAERNTSKQISARETALRNVYKYSRKEFFFFFFLNRSEFEGSGVEEVE